MPADRTPPCASRSGRPLDQQRQKAMSLYRKNDEFTTLDRRLIKRFVRAIDASNARRRIREKSSARERICLIKRQTKGRIVGDRCEFACARLEAWERHWQRASTPSMATCAAKIPLSSPVDGNASNPHAALLALADSSVPAGCGFQSFAARSFTGVAAPPGVSFATWMKIIRS